MNQTVPVAGAPRRPRHRLHRVFSSIDAVATALVLLAVLFGGLTAWELWRARVETFRNAASISENLAITIASNVSRTIEVHDFSIRTALDAFGLPGIDQASEAIRRNAIFRNPMYIAHLGVMLVTDETGRVIMESGSVKVRAPSVAQRAYFTEQSRRPDLGLYISAPFRALTDNSPQIGLSRRYEKPGGGFGGVIMSALKLDYLDEMTAALNLAAGASVFIANRDGTILSRSPGSKPPLAGEPNFNPAFAATAAGASGYYLADSWSDQVAQMYAYSRAGEFPITVIVTTPLSTVYAVWARDAVVTGCAIVLMIGATLVLAGRLRRELVQRQAAESSARGLAAEYRLLAENMSDIIMRLDLDGVRTYVSPAEHEMLGYELGETIGASWNVCVHPDDWPIIVDALRQLRQGAEKVHATYRGVHKTGGETWLEARMQLLPHPDTRAPPDVIVSARDVTWQRNYEEQLALMAGTDGLTGIGNRRMFDERLANEWNRALRIGANLSLIMLDADFFKLYNDCYGHVAGDAVLRSIAECLRLATGRSGDYAARYGGEEFAVILPNLDLAGATVVAEKIRAAVMARAIGHERSAAGVVTVSVGVVSLIVVAALEPPTLIREADAALYEAKSHGRNQVVAHTAGASL